MNILCIILLFCLLLLVALCIARNPSIVSSYIGGDAVKDLNVFPRSRSEASVIKILEDLCQDKFPTVNPSWLVWRGRTLELDGYNEKLGIALEFSGPLHTKWFPTKESYAKYFERIVKDVVKKRTCKKKGVHLIIIDMSLPPRHWKNYLLSRLYDIGMQSTKPYGYIDEQIASPFRNKQLEQELNLKGDMCAAKKI